MEIRRRFHTLDLLLGTVLSCLLILLPPSLAQEPKPRAPRSRITRAPPPQIISGRVKLVRSRDSPGRIHDLFWDNRPPTPSYVVAASGRYPVVAEFEIKVLKNRKSAVLISGNYPHRDWNLLFESRPLKASGQVEGKFSIGLTVPRPGAELPIHLTAVGPHGEIQRENFILIAPGFAVGSTEPLELTKSGSSFFYSGGVGVTYINDLETQTNGQRSYESFSLTGKLSATYALSPPRWDVGLGGYFTLLPLTRRYNSSNPEEANPDLTARFLGLNFRIGYTFQGVPQPWNIGLQAGWYYTTMFVSQEVLTPNGTPPFGFSNLSGPQLFPTIRRTLSKSGTSILFYGKFSPVSNNFSVLSLSSREIAGGTAYFTLLRNKHVMSFALDVSNLKFNLPENENYRASSTTISLGLGYSF